VKSIKRVMYLLLAIMTTFFFLPQTGQSQDTSGNANFLLNGSYSGIFSGWLVTNTFPQPFAGTGLFISDGKGHISGHENFNLNGRACDYILKGTYSVARDGTGIDAIQFLNGAPGCLNGSFTQTLAVVAGGDLIVLSNTNFPDVATEHWYRVRKPRQ
jgi:hypothetical protein